MKKLLTVIIALVLAFSVTSFAFAEGNDTSQAGIGNGQASIGNTQTDPGNTQTDPGNTQANPGSTQTKVQAKAAVPQEIQDKRDQLTALYAQSLSIRGELATLRGQFLNKLSGLVSGLVGLTGKDRKAAREHLKLLKESLSADRNEAKTLWEQLKFENDTMKTYRTQLQEAIKAADYTSAGTILDNMIAQKTAKNADLSKLVTIRQDMLAQISK